MIINLKKIRCQSDRTKFYESICIWCVCTEEEEEAIVVSYPTKQKHHSINHLLGR